MLKGQISQENRETREDTSIIRLDYWIGRGRQVLSQLFLDGGDITSPDLDYLLYSSFVWSQRTCSRYFGAKGTCICFVEMRFRGRYPTPACVLFDWPVSNPGV